MTLIIPRKYLYLIKKSREVLGSERITVSAYGGEEARRVFKIASARHTRFPLLQQKSLGAALYRLPENPNDVFRGPAFHEARRKMRRAMKAGFVYREVSPRSHFEEILAINTSCPNRQNRPLDKTLSDPHEVMKFCQQSAGAFGILSTEGQLTAYASGVVCGDVFVLDRMIGHYQDLEFGIMYLLGYNVLSDMTAQRLRGGNPLYVQHDMYWGVSPGLRKFKNDLGFLPHIVKWVWTDAATQL